MTANLQQQRAAYYTAHSPSSIYHYNYPQPAQHHYQQLQASHIGLYHHHQQQPPQNYHAGHFQKQHQQQLPAFNGGSSIPMVKDSGLIGGLVGSNSSSSLSDPSSPASSSSYQPTYTTVMNSSSSTHDPNAAALAQNKEWFGKEKSVRRRLL